MRNSVQCSKKRSKKLSPIKLNLITKVSTIHLSSTDVQRNSITIPISIDNRIVLALVDTGAQITTISQDVFSTLNQPNPTTTNPNIIRSFNGSAYLPNSLKTTNITFKIQTNHILKGFWDDWIL